MIILKFSMKSWLEFHLQKGEDTDKYNEHILCPFTSLKAILQKVLQAISKPAANAGYLCPALILSIALQLPSWEKNRKTKTLNIFLLKTTHIKHHFAISASNGM